MPSIRQTALTSAALFALALSASAQSAAPRITAADAGPRAAVSVEPVTVAPAQSPGFRRVAVAGTSISYPYTVEIPSDWQVHEGGLPKRALWLAPPAVLNPDLDPDAIGVLACALSLANPEQVAANIKGSLKGLKTGMVKEIDGVRGVLSEFDQGASTVLALMLPTSTGCVQFLGMSPRAQFAAHRAYYERILFSVRREEAELPPTKTPPSEARAATTAATPQTVSAPTSQSVSAGAQMNSPSPEPRGLAVTGGVSEQEFFRNWEAARSRVRHELVSWGTDKADVIRTLAPSGLPVCVPAGRSLELCSPQILEWSADFGPNAPGHSRADASLFFFEGKFFKYSLDFLETVFGFVQDTVAARLGAPTEKKSSTVQNLLGARFNQDEVIWKTANTVVIVTRRSPNNLEHGEMVVLYLPIAMKVPTQDAGKAPF